MYLPLQKRHIHAILKHHSQGAKVQPHPKLAGGVQLRGVKAEHPVQLGGYLQDGGVGVGAEGYKDSVQAVRGEDGLERGDFRSLFSEEEQIDIGVNTSFTVYKYYVQRTLSLF